MAGVRRGIRLGTAHGRGHGEAAPPRGDQRSVLVRHGCPEERSARPAEGTSRTGFSHRHTVRLLTSFSSHMQFSFLFFFTATTVFWRILLPERTC